MPAVVRPGDAFARVQPHAGRRPEALGRRHRHHQIAPREADRVLHTALLPAAPGIAEPDLDAVALNKPLEHVDDGDSVPRDPVRGAGGVVEHHHPRGRPHMGEHRLQPLAHAFGVLPGQRDHMAHVRIRERGDQAVHVRPFAPDHGQGPAEIDLHDAGLPLQFHESVARLPPITLALPHVVLHELVGTVIAALVPRPVPYAHRAVALLARHHAVGLKPLVDHRLERVRLRLRLRVSGRLGRAILQFGVLPDRLP